MLRKGEKGGPKVYELGKFGIIPELYEQVGDKSDVKVNPFTWDSNFVYDSRKGTLRWDIVNDLVGTYLIDAHDTLRNAWKTVLQKRASETALKEILSMPVSEQQVREMAEQGLWEDAAFRQKMRQLWSNNAQDKYQGANRGWQVWKNVPVVLILVGVIWMYGYSRKQRKRILSSTGLHP